MPAIDDLTFLTGRWQGEGFRTEFGHPHGTMLFGSMQALENGRTVYWETFRFADEEGRLVCYPSQMGTPSGVFRSVESSRGDRPAIVLEDPENVRHRRIGFELIRDGELRLFVEGVGEAPARQEWRASRV